MNIRIDIRVDRIAEIDIETTELSEEENRIIAALQKVAEQFGLNTVLHKRLYQRL